VVDLCHGIAPHDVLDGAYTLAQAYPYYPKDTIHLVVVDPGVGSSRRPLVAHAGGYYFIAPDNGVLSLVYDREPEVSVRHINASHYYLPSLSNTFHGRDLFAPIAGWLAKGVEPDKFGEEITDFIRFNVPKPRSESDGVHGVVLKIDRFGNLVTNIRPQDVPGLAEQPQDGSGRSGPPFTLTVGKGKVGTMQRSYADGAQGELFAIWGSGGYLEVSSNRNSAARLSGAERGAEVVVQVK
jgi:S-adenosylmethionine hydrolase